MNQRRRLAVWLLLAASGLAEAQESATVLDKVEIVGSRISRIAAETALPVQVIRREEIERSGAQTTEELLAKVSANIGNWTDALNIGASDRPGFSGASLRGLGSQATLVLLNGRRLANYAFSGTDIGTDLHAIPLAAIERVEILKDGASAIYGSDAIAGVINFVLRSDFRGVELQAHAGDSEAGGGSRTRGTISLGLGDPAKDGYNLFAIIDHQKDGELAARDRPFSATAYRPQDGLNRTSSNTFPGNISVGNGQYTNPAAPGCTDFTVFTRGGCAYDYARQTDDLAPSERTSVLARGTLRIGAAHEAFAEVLYETHSELYRISATPVSNLATNGDIQIDVPTTSPYYPQGLGLVGDITDVRYRTVTLGPRTSESRSDNERALVGMKGNLMGWDYDGALAIAASHAKYSYPSNSGFVDSLALANAFATGLIDPFADSGPAGDALLASTQVQGLGRTATGITRTFDAHASRDVARLPAGPLAVALGGEWRRETLEDIEEPLSLHIAGNSFSPPKTGSRDVLAMFVELNVPILHDLESQLALRRDHYSDFGTSWNPKAALRWQPAKSLLMRASVGRGFRAPSLPELYTARVTGLAQLDPPGDPVRCPVTHLDSDCNPIVTGASGGNPQLTPVRSNQGSAGIVFEPTPNWNASIDYWTIRLRDDIGNLDFGTILNNLAVFEGKNVFRGPADPAFPGLPGPIIRIETYNQNLGQTRTSGFDVGAGYRSDPSSLGRFSARLDGTLVTQWVEQLDGIHDLNRLGAGINGPIPRWRHTLSLGWERSPYGVTVGQSFQSGYTDENPLPDGSMRRVASYTLWDLQLAYAATPDLSLRLGVRNLFDRDPPFTNQSDSFQVGYYPGYADPRGRFWYATVSLRFH
jgi:iron complex outermembrane receptor protein